GSDRTEIRADVWRANRRRKREPQLLFWQFFSSRDCGFRAPTAPTRSANWSLRVSKQIVCELSGSIRPDFVKVRSSLTDSSRTPQRLENIDVVTEFLGGDKVARDYGAWRPRRGVNRQTGNTRVPVRGGPAAAPA